MMVLSESDLVECLWVWVRFEGLVWWWGLGWGSFFFFFGGGGLVDFVLW